MRIAFLSDSISRRSGGLFDANRRLAQSLSQRGCELGTFGVTDSDSEADRRGWLPVPVYVAPARGPRALGYAPGLGRLLADFAPSIVHSHGLWNYTSVLSSRWRRLNARPVVVHPHGMLDPWALQNGFWKKRLAGWAFERENLGRASCIRALCESETHSIRKFGLRNAICTIPNGIDAPTTTAASKPPWTEEGRHVLLYLGRLHPKKNLGPLLQAWNQCVRDNSHRVKEWKLVIAGWDQGGYEEKLKQQALELGLQASVEFVGPQFGDAKASAYAHSDAFILPSLSEGLPMVVLEAWSYGKPVLMTSECNLPDGFAAQAAIQVGTDANSISIGLRQLFEMDERQRVDIGECGRQLTLEKFSWPAIGEEMHRVCEWVLGGGSAPASVRKD